MQISLAIVGILTIWLLVLSLAFGWIFKYFRKLSGGVDKGNLVKILEKVLETEIRNTKDLRELEREIAQVEEEGTFHLQKLGLVRFNPFDEIGGDHSFTLALLDANDTGVILTGLHTRERTRVYIKKIKKGKSEHELSEEEGKALQLAKKTK